MAPLHSTFFLILAQAPAPTPIFKPYTYCHLKMYLTVPVCLVSIVVEFLFILAASFLTQVQSIFIKQIISIPAPQHYFYVFLIFLPIVKMCNVVLQVKQRLHKFISEQLSAQRVPLCINPSSAAFKSFASSTVAHPSELPPSPHHWE